MRPNILQLLGNNIKKYRIQQGMTQEEVAQKLNISFKRYMSIENGNNNVPGKLVYKIADLFDVEAYYLLMP